MDLVKSIVRLVLDKLSKSGRTVFIWTSIIKVVVFIGLLISCSTSNVKTGEEIPQSGEMHALGGISDQADWVEPILNVGTTYYVSPRGGDDNPGTIHQPWASPAFAVSQMEAGDTLVIMDGRYILSDYDRDVIRPPSGTFQAWVSIIGEPDHRPVLVGRDNLAMVIDLSGSQFVRLENLEITHDDQVSGQNVWFRDGISVMDEPANHILIKDLYIHHLDEFGINIGDVDQLRILDSRIEYAGFGAIGGPAGSAGGWRNVYIQNCSLAYSGHYYQGGDGTSRPYDRPDGFGIEASAGPIIIENTLASHNYGDGLDSKAANTTIRDTIIANNSCDGVKLWGSNSRLENVLIYGRGDGSLETTPWSSIVIGTQTPNARFEMINVTVDDYLGGNYLMYVQYDQPDIPVQLIIRNSIFRGIGENSPIFIGEASHLTVDHTLFYLPVSEYVLEHGEYIFDPGNLDQLGDDLIYTAPLFRAPAWGGEGDYHLSPDSPAINAGTSLNAPTVDLEGLKRDSYPDLGAYEN
jgi:hypothetical protein